LVVVLALGTALVIRALNLPNGLRSSALYMCVPAATVLMMLPFVTRDGYTRAGWSSLGLHRLGLRAWCVAIVPGAGRSGRHRHRLGQPPWLPS
jgi:hypothetical protein